MKKKDFIKLLFTLYFLWFSHDKIIAQNPEKISSENNFEFVENIGQWDNPSLYSVQMNGAELFIEKNALQYFFYDQGDIAKLVKHPRAVKEDFKSYTVKGHALRINFLSCNENTKAIGSQPFKHYYNYFRGNNSKRWKSFVKPFAEVSLQKIYPGIDIKLYTESRTHSLKYDLILQPGADPENIKMNYEGAENLKIRSGALYAQTSVRTYIELKPFAYQIVDGQTKKIKCDFILTNNTLSFKLGSYDHSIPLVIDPVVIFSTYSGSTADNFGHTATYDHDGNFYAAGIVTGPFASFNPNGRYPATVGAFMQTYNGGTTQWPESSFPCDISISKYNNDGSALMYATYLGGNRNDYPHSLVVDKDNRLIVYGSTCSNNFPVTYGAYDTTFNSTTNESDIIVTKFNTTGSALIGSTYLGGSSWDGIMWSDPSSVIDTLSVNYADEFRGEVQVNNANEIVIATTTFSSNFPTTSGAFQTVNKGLQEACIFKFDSTLKKLIWSSYLGESNNDAAYSLDIDSIGNIYVAGGTQSKNFPITSGVYQSSFAGGPVDGFITKISSNGSAIMRSMYWGGAKYDQTYFVKLDTKGKVNVFGQTFDSMPVTSNVYSSAKGSLYISRFSNNLDSLEFSTVIGNGVQNNALSPSAFIVDACGNIYASCWGGETNLYGNGYTNFHYAHNTALLPITSDALQSSTDNSDFYLFVLKKDAKTLFYGSYLGGNQSGDHVDGGTSRFDKRGIIYQSICSSCHNSYYTLSDFPTTPGSYSPLNKSPRCSNAAYKLDFRLSDLVIADFLIYPRNSCSDTVLTFTNKSYNGKQFYWYIDNVLKDTARNYKYSFPKKGNHQIKLVAVDSSRCIIVDSIAKTVNIAASSNSDFTFIRDSCSFKVSFTNNTFVANGDSVPYFWKFGDGDTSTQKNPIHTFFQGGNYFVTLISNPGTLCADTTQKTFYLDTTKYQLEPRIKIIPLQSCLPSSVSFFNRSINGKKIFWYYDNILKDSVNQFSDSFFLEKTVVVKLVVMDSVTCKKIDSTNQTISTVASSNASFITVPDTCGKNYSFTNTSTSYKNIPVKYLWDFGDGDTSTQKNPTHKYLDNGVYIIKLVCNSGTACADSFYDYVVYDSAYYFVVPKFDPLPWYGCSPQFLTCANLTQNNRHKFYWYTNGVLRDSTFNFQDSLILPNLYRIKLIVVDSNTCNIADSITQNVFVDVSSKSAFTLFRDTCSPLVFFTNKSTTFQNNVVNYYWTFGDGTSSYSKDPISHAYPSSGNYTVTLYSGSGPCTDTSFITFNYDITGHILKAGFQVSDTFLCIPQILQISNTSSGGKYFYWYVNDVFVSSSKNYSINISSTGITKIKLVVIDSSRCNFIDSFETSVNAIQKSTADFGISADVCSRELFFKNKTGMPGIPYKWNFGDGDSSFNANPSHSYSKPGTYIIKLISNAGTKCADTTFKQYNFNGDTIDELIIPNAFSPNGDGINDFFEIRGVSWECDTFHIFIFNRWENPFFESSDPRIMWNGKNERGVEASDDVYFYLLYIKKHSGKEMNIHGTITLVTGVKN